MSQKNSKQKAEAISQDLTSLLDDTIDYCLEQLVYEGDFPVMLATQDTQKQRDLISFNGDELEDCLLEARRRLSPKHTKNITQYAIAYNGAIEEIEGQGFSPALIIEYGEENLSCGYSLYMLYEHEGDVKHFNYTDPAAAGETELYIKE